MQIEMHSAAAKDFDELVALYTLLLGAAPKLSMEFIGEFLERRDQYLVIARIDNTAAGLIAWTVWPAGLSFPQKVCFIQDLVVVPEKRKQGIGGALLGHVRHWATDHKIRIMHLQCSIQDNISFYQKNGFKPCNQGFYEFIQ